jgi:hypothetical protein
MATQDARSTTLRDLNVDPNVAAREHTPSLHPRERFVRCTTCGVTVPYSVTAEGPIRRALEELASVGCGRYELPDVPVGDHVPTVTPEHPTKGRSVVCESCGRTASLDGDRERVLEELAEIPCIARLSHTELNSVVFSPNAFSPPLVDLGISNWYGRLGGSYDEEIVRQFHHDRFQYTVYIRSEPDDAYTAALVPSPNTQSEPIDELRFPSADPDDPVSRRSVVEFVTFLSATDPLTPGEFAELHGAYEEAYQSHREAWLADAYGNARETFEERFGDTPEAFTEAFSDSSAGTEEVLRRTVGSGGFTDPSEPEFAREILGHDHEFPSFIDFVADNHAWSPPVPE